MPLELLKQWLKEEKERGAPNPQQAVLSTVTKNSIPHSRVVAIREINPAGLTFFTQKGTRKVEEMHENPQVTLSFWLELLQRQIIIEGIIEALSNLENEEYWRTYPREAQVRFYAYSPTSGQPITSKSTLEDKLVEIEEQYKDKELPMSPYYCGYRLKPACFYFYEYCKQELSNVFKYTYLNNEWHKTILSP